MSDASFSSLRLWISEVFDFACLLAGLGRLRLLRLICPLAFVSFFHLLSSHFYTCFRLVFPLALAFLVDLLRVSTCFMFRLASCFDLLRVSTCFVFRLASCCDLLRLDLSTSLRAIAVNPLGGLVIFRILGAYIDSSLGMHIPALWVPLDFSVVKCTLVLHSGISGRVNPLFTRRCSADDLSRIGIVAW